MRMAFVLLMGVLAGGVDEASRPAADSARQADSPADQPDVLLREGQTVEIVGRLELAGDRAILYPEDGSPSLRVLENLALERVTRILSESRGRHQWLVTGTITEYRGSNYLLITRAVQRSAPKDAARAASTVRKFSEKHALGTD